MKRSLFMKIISVFVIIIFILFMTYYTTRPPSRKLSSREQTMVIMETGGCLDCHIPGGHIPFYGNWSIIGDMVKKDIAEGYRYFDITEFYRALKYDERPPEVDLAKVEWVTAHGTMPLRRYRTVHWGSALNDTEKDMVQNWVNLTRQKYYYNNLSAPRFINESVYPIPDSLPVDPGKVALGEILFHDVRLSTDNSISCASCHDLAMAGVDNKRYSIGVRNQEGGVNAPTVYDAVFNFSQFWDGRAHDLAMQAGGPPLNPIEMASGSWDEIIGKLAADKVFAAKFAAVYPEGFSEATITDAISVFEHTLITPDSDFDRFLKGDPAALSAQAQRGFELFKDNKCATCHVGVNMGGQSYELIGLRGDYFADRGGDLTLEDDGRFQETQFERDRHRFKVPGLRNVALTWPYFHDGTLLTLEDAVNHMNTYQVGRNITEKETADIIAFLESLTGKYKGVKLTNP